MYDHSSELMIIKDHSIFATKIVLTSLEKIWSSVGFCPLKYTYIRIFNTYMYWIVYKKKAIYNLILIPHCSRITQVSSADEFYTTMGTLTQEILDNDIVNADDLIKVPLRVVLLFLFLYENDL